MTYNYLVTTNKDLLPSGPICMVDGTVPGWERKPGDLHFDHHRPGGQPIQLWEIPGDVQVSEDVTFVTTTVDADACAAAAWIQLLNTTAFDLTEVRLNLSAIAYDCDHLGLPQMDLWSGRHDFAAKAVAALKETGRPLAAELGLPEHGKDMTEAQKVQWASEAFKRGTEWLAEAALGKRPWPGESGEADAYFARLEEQRPAVWDKCSIYQGCVLFDKRSFKEYIDPRLVVQFARQSAENTSPITLTISDGAWLPNAIPNLAMPQYHYILGSVQLHPAGSPMFSDRGIWNHLNQMECARRDELGLPWPQTQWGGRNEVGGSSWRDSSIIPPEDVIDAVIDFLYNDIPF